MKEKRFILLYLGLSFLAVAFLLKYAFNVSQPVFAVTLGTAIALKVLFLILSFLQKGFRLKLPIVLILIGVAMILVAINCKDSASAIVYYLLFYGAIGLKISGLILLII